MPHDRGGHGLEVVQKDPVERFRIECFGERHRLDDVHEEDRDESAKLHRRAHVRSLVEKQRVVLAQDRRLELAELVAWIDAELVDEDLTRSAVCRERVGLPPRPIESEHQLCARTLSERLRLDERFELRDELGVTTQGEVGVDALLEHDRAELLESRDLVLRERLVEEVRECRAAPEAERLAQRALRSDRIAAHERGAPLLRQPRETVDVDVFRCELEHVPGRTRCEHRPERLPELGDVDLNCVPRRFRWLARPECLDEAID